MVIHLRDFFICYTERDLSWAEWIAHSLEAAGYTTFFQKRDIPVGSNFVLEMDRALSETSKTILVLSKSFHEILFTQPEWASRFVDDPMGFSRRILPVRIDRCRPVGLLRAISYLDLVGLAESQARQALLEAVAPVERQPTTQALFTTAVGAGTFPVSSESQASPESVEKTAQIEEGLQLLERCADELGASTEVMSVAIVDIDGMSGLNKKFGVEVGNLVLKALGRYYEDAFLTVHWDAAVTTHSLYFSGNQKRRREQT